MLGSDLVHPSVPVAIVGASGFLGSHLLHGLAARGHPVVGFVRANSSRARFAAGLQDGRFSILETDFSPGDLAGKVMEVGAQCVINTVGYGLDPQQRSVDEGLMVNVRIALDIIDAASQAGADAIHIGSAYEYGITDEPIGEHAPISPDSFYGITKASASLMIKLKAREISTRVLIVRPFTIYGPDEIKSKFIPAIIAACRSGAPIKLSDGSKVRDFLHIEDFINAFDLILSSRTDWPEAVNIGSGRPTRLRYVAERICAHTSADPSLLQWGSLPARQGDPRRLVADPTLLSRLFGWSASTSLDEGLGKTIVAFDERERALARESEPEPSRLALAR